VLHHRIIKRELTNFRDLFGFTSFVLFIIVLPSWLEHNENSILLFGGYCHAGATGLDGFKKID
jgi:hypothetical protein